MSINLKNQLSDLEKTIKAHISEARRRRPGVDDYNLDDILGSDSDEEKKEEPVSSEVVSVSEEEDQADIAAKIKSLQDELFDDDIELDDDFEIFDASALILNKEKKTVYKKDSPEALKMAEIGKDVDKILAANNALYRTRFNFLFTMQVKAATGIIAVPTTDKEKRDIRNSFKITSSTEMSPEELSSIKTEIDRLVDEFTDVVKGDVNPAFDNKLIRTYDKLYSSTYDKQSFEKMYKIDLDKATPEQRRVYYRHMDEYNKKNLRGKDMFNAELDLQRSKSNVYDEMLASELDAADSGDLSAKKSLKGSADALTVESEEELLSMMEEHDPDSVEAQRELVAQLKYKSSPEYFDKIKADAAEWVRVDKIYQELAKNRSYYVKKMGGGKSRKSPIIKAYLEEVENARKSGTFNPVEVFNKIEAELQKNAAIRNIKGSEMVAAFRGEITGTSGARQSIVETLQYYNWYNTNRSERAKIISYLAGIYLDSLQMFDLVDDEYITKDEMQKDMSKVMDKEKLQAYSDKYFDEDVADQISDDFSEIRKYVVNDPEGLAKYFDILNDTEVDEDDFTEERFGKSTEERDNIITAFLESTGFRYFYTTLMREYFGSLKSLTQNRIYAGLKDFFETNQKYANLGIFKTYEKGSGTTWTIRGGKKEFAQIANPIVNLIMNTSNVKEDLTLKLDGRFDYDEAQIENTKSLLLNKIKSAVKVAKNISGSVVDQNLGWFMNETNLKEMADDIWNMMTDRTSTLGKARLAYVELEDNTLEDFKLFVENKSTWKAVNKANLSDVEVREDGTSEITDILDAARKKAEKIHRKGKATQKGSPSSEALAKLKSSSKTNIIDCILKSLIMSELEQLRKDAVEDNKKDEELMEKTKELVEDFANYVDTYRAELLRLIVDDENLVGRLGFESDVFKKDLIAVLKEDPVSLIKILVDEPYVLEELNLQFDTYVKILADLLNSDPSYLETLKTDYPDLLEGLEESSPGFLASVGLDKLSF